ncbi:hypothetical protein BpHYR1_037088 [Brachionus plicatilis]|uniref:Uncharacterized protein n=1 Tax=Brachionus plicatilis TaxID=10195 RepID=A0A3M7SBP4_BRAPC|nr:hypothetical protein BpHYR1_037088 [Brachionus plicatilis]
MRTNVDLYTDTMLCLKHLLDLTAKQIDADLPKKIKNHPKLLTKIKRLQTSKKKKFIKYEFIFSLDQFFENPKLNFFQLKAEHTNWTLSTIFRINFFDIFNSILIYSKSKTKQNDDIFEPKNVYLSARSQDSETDLICPAQILKSEPVLNNFDDFVFKTPHRIVPFIESTQEFSYLAPTQFFCYDPIDEFGSSQSFSFNTQKSYEHDLIETQVLEDDSAACFTSSNSKPKLIKKKSSDKILERKFINFNPNYNNLNSDMSDAGFFSSQPVRSQAICQKMPTQLSLNLTPAKPVKKKSFITIGLSKKQKIKKHLHNI